MFSYRKAGALLAVVGFIFLAAQFSLAADPAAATKPATQPASAPTSAPTSQADAKEWAIPAVPRLGCFTVADGQYAVIEDLPPPPDPNAPPLQPGQVAPPPPKPKWHLLDLKTGKVTNLLNALKECAGDFKVDELTWIDFSPDGKALLAHTGAGGPRQPWWFDLAAKKGITLVNASGTQCFWVGDKIIQYEPRPIGVGYVAAVPIVGRAIDLAKNKTNPCRLPGTVVAINDKGTHMVCQTVIRIPRKPAKPIYGIFLATTGKLTGSPLSGITTPAPQFAISPGGKYLLALVYDDQGVAALGGKTVIVPFAGRKPFPLAQTASPVYINDLGRALTRTDKGAIHVWDVKGKESEEVASNTVTAGVWNSNLYYIAGTGDQMKLYMKSLPQLKIPDPKVKPTPPAGGGSQ